MECGNDGPGNLLPGPSNKTFCGCGATADPTLGKPAASKAYGIPANKEGSEASGVGARIKASAVPIIPGVRELVAEDMVPGGTERNLDYLETCKAVRWEEGVSQEDKLLLSDAQTAGGLLISVPAHKAQQLRRLLEQAETPAVAEVGEIVAGPEGVITVGS